MRQAVSTAVTGIDSIHYHGDEMGAVARNRSSRISLAFIVIYLASLFYTELSGRTGIPAIPPHINIWFTLCVMGAAMTSGFVVLGYGRTFFFWGIAATLAWCAEQAGVATGLIFGHYHYTALAGPKLGNVPVLIPAGWFMMLYPSHVIATLCIHGKPSVVPRNTGAAIALSILTGLVMTAWDLVVDPGAARPGGQWVWEEEGAYFGVPLMNYAGWAGVSFVVALSWRIVEMRRAFVIVQPISRLATVLPLLIYGAVLLGSIRFTGIPAVGLIGCFAMGIPLFIAALRAEIV